MQKFTKFALSLVMVFFAIAANAETKTITWDFAGLEQSSADGEYNGWTYIMNNGGTSDYISAGGFHWNGSSKPAIRNAKYTPENDGKMTIYYRSNNATATDRIVALGTSVITGNDIEVLKAKEVILNAGLTDSSKVLSFEADVKAGVPVYVFNANGGCTVTKIEYSYEEGEEEAAMTTSTSLMLGEDEVAINDHSAVSVENADAIKVQVENEPSVIGFSYNINAMKAVEDEEGTTWVADESYDIAVGEGNFNGGMGYAQFNDGTINFEQGNKYQVKVTVYGGDPTQDPAELGVYTYVIDGAYAPQMTVSSALMLGEDEVAINDHSAVSVENADAIKVQVENEPSVIGFSYNINAMKAVETEEGTTWVADESYDIAVGEGNFNGGMGYAQFNDGTINFEEGNKYQVKVTVYGGDPTQDPAELGVYTYVINGAYAPQMTVSSALMLGEDEVAINDHSAVSVENADAIKVQVENEPSVIGFSYNINAMKAVETEEGTTWVADESYDIAVGEGNFNGGTGYAQFNDGTINFEEGNKYQVKVTVYGGDPTQDPAELGVYTYVINGAYAPQMTVSSALMLGEDEVAINDHSEVSVENADAIKVQVENEPSVIGFSYNINAMKAVEDEEGTTWVADESYDIAVGEGNFNGGTGYAQFNDGTINFEEGNKYQVKVTVYGGDPTQDPAELGVYTYVINGAYVAAMTTSTSLMLGEDEVAINDHSSVSVENADAIKVQVENEPSVIGFTYAINAMNLNEDEEGQFWTVGAELAVGEGNFNGGTGYAQFENGTINFEEGNKYQVSVSVMGGNPAEPAELASYTYEINGAYVYTPAIEVALLSEETEFTILEGRDVTVELPVSAIKVTGLDQVQDTIRYAIYSKTGTMAEGILSVNTIGYAEFAPIALVSGVKYNVVLTANGETIFDAIAIGAVVVPPTVEFWNGFALVQDGAEIDLAETKSINVNVQIPDGVDINDDLFIEGVLVGKDGTYDPIFGYTDFEDGVDVDLSRYTPGNAYQIQITKICYGEVVGMDEETYMPIYENNYVAVEGDALATLNIAIKAPEQPATTNITVNYVNGVLDIFFTEHEDVAPSWNVDILLNDQKINSEIGMEWNDIYGYPGEELADGDYTLVFPVGSLMLEGNENTEEYTVTFCIKDGKIAVDFSELEKMIAYANDMIEAGGENAEIEAAIAGAYDVLDKPNVTQAQVNAAVKALQTATAINAVASVNKNNSVIYNLSGQKVNAAKGIVIINGKKFMVK